MRTTQLYDALASLLTYPEAPFDERLTACRLALDGRGQEAFAPLQHFIDAAQGMTIEDLQELYTRTFDLNPVCSLELGWQLFGENYSRGEFLVEMRQTLRRLDVPESTELPDHLTHALAAFGRMEESEANRFASMFLLPALAKMVGGLDGKDCPYTSVLQSIRQMIGVTHPTALAEKKSAALSLALPIVDPVEVCHG